jgi:hypothetical protein
MNTLNLTFFSVIQGHPFQLKNDGEQLKGKSVIKVIP